MFKGLFKKKINKHDIDKIKVTYEGGVISADYEARSINRTDVNDQDYPYHSLFPHGNGKITYTIGKKVIEEYEGEFEAGQYHGKGKLKWEGKVFKGKFKENKFIEN